MERKWQNTVIVIITDDVVLVQTLGGRLREWGATVFHSDADHTPPRPAICPDVVLVDIRDQTTEELRMLSAIQQEMPFAELLLINSNDNIKASMAGRRAGASDELVVPFDTGTIRQQIIAACGRSRNRQKMKKHRSMLTVFGDAMSAATFAQAGEFETALDILNGNASRKNPADDAARNNPKR